MPIRADRKISMAMKWLIKYSTARNDKSMAQKLAAEVIAASREEVLLSRRKLILTKWQKLIKLSLTLNFN